MTRYWKLVDWSAMETAPRDGSEILAWREDCGCMIVRWTCPANTMSEHELEMSDLSPEDEEKEDWFYADQVRMDGNEAPTHWMPLPAGPEAES